MAEYIDREAFIADKRRLYCTDCDRRKGKKRGKYVTLYEIGEAPCKSCWVGDMLDETEVYPAADVKPVVRGEWEKVGTIENTWLVSKCSVCGSQTIDAGEYCPNCGARMEVDDG